MNIRINVTVQSRTPSDPLRCSIRFQNRMEQFRLWRNRQAIGLSPCGPPPSEREALGEQIHLIGSLSEGAGWQGGKPLGLPQARLREFLMAGLNRYELRMESVNPTVPGFNVGMLDKPGRPLVQ